MNHVELARRSRLPLGFLLGALYLVFATPKPSLLWLGLAMALAGLLIRGWAAGHISKNVALSVSGPYAHVRNPLYLGSFLIALGFAVVWQWWFVALVMAFFALVYAPTMEQERLAMARRFPAEFPEYERNVPSFMPRFTAWKPQSSSGEPPRRFDSRLYLRHAEWKAALGFFAGSAWLLLRLRLGL